MSRQLLLGSSLISSHVGLRRRIVLIGSTITPLRCLSQHVRREENKGTKRQHKLGPNAPSGNNNGSWQQRQQQGNKDGGERAVVEEATRAIIPSSSGGGTGSFLNKGVLSPLDGLNSSTPGTVSNRWGAADPAAVLNGYAKASGIRKQQANASYQGQSMLGSRILNVFNADNGGGHQRQQQQHQPHQKQRQGQGGQQHQGNQHGRQPPHNGAASSPLHLNGKPHLNGEPPVSNGRQSSMDQATFDRYSNFGERIKQAQLQKEQANGRINGSVKPDSSSSQQQPKLNGHSHHHQQQQQHHEAKLNGHSQQQQPKLNGQTYQQQQQQQQQPKLNGHSQQQQQFPQAQAQPQQQQSSPFTPAAHGDLINGFSGLATNRWNIGSDPTTTTAEESAKQSKWKARRLQQQAERQRVKMWGGEEDSSKQDFGPWVERQQQGKRGEKDQEQQQQKGSRRNRIKLDRRLRSLARIPLVLPHEPITIRELASKLSLKMPILIKRVETLGIAKNITADYKLDLDYAELIGLEMRRQVTRMPPKENLLEYKSMSRETRPDWPLRPPVVCVMGHVDHGKTTLLDALRKTKVAEGEAGGITQRLGAFHIRGLSIPTINSSSNSKSPSSSSSSSLSSESLGVTVLDTPGHAAFCAMRLNGASATDIVLLVVSATDGIQDQTEEVLKLVQKEQVPLMVAVTKVDKLGSEDEVADAIGKMERSLAELGIMTESLGGEVQIVPVSAVNGMGLSDLTERLMLQAEVLELRADKEVPGEGLVLDCHIDKGLGQVSSVLMRWGALQPGDYVVAGDQYTRVKKIMDDTGRSLDKGLPSIFVRLLGFKELPAPSEDLSVIKTKRPTYLPTNQQQIMDDTGRSLEKGLPSMPVRLLGFKELPAPGEGLIVVKSEERAKAVADARRKAAEQQRLEEAEVVQMLYDDEQEQLAELMETGNFKMSKKTRAFLAMQQGQAEGSDGSGLAQKRGPIVVPFLVKADGKGTLDAVTSSLAAYDSDIIRAEVVGAGCGAVTLGDLERAKAAGDGMAGKAVTILAFDVGYANGDVGETARREGLVVKKQSVIYSLLDDVKETLQSYMPMERIETPVGRLEVQAKFSLTGRRRTRNQVAGCRVLHGQAFSNPTYRYRVLRGDEVVCKESLPTTLYHFKEQVQEVQKGMECGLSLESFGDFEKGDVIECFTVAEKPKQLKDVFRF